MNLLQRLFTGKSNRTSRTNAKQRLKFILAHDRVSLTPQLFEEMRREIMQVVSKYVELDEDSLQISLETDQRNTSVIANLPIRSIREEPQAAPEPDFDLSNDALEVKDKDDTEGKSLKIESEGKSEITKEVKEEITEGSSTSGPL